MGSSVSSCNPGQIKNLNARNYFQSVLDAHNSTPDDVKTSDFKKMVITMYDFLKKLPENEDNISAVITGSNAGIIYLNHINTRLNGIPETLTKISFRRSGLNAASAKMIADFILKSKHLEEFDGSENKFGDSVYPIINAVGVHENLNTLILESCQMGDGSITSIAPLIANNRHLTTLRIDLPKLSPSSCARIIESLKNNRYLTVAAFKNDTIAPKVDEMVERNQLINGYIKNMCDCPFKRQFSSRMVTFKSIKGRQMLEGRAKMKNEEKQKGSERFKDMENADATAASLGDAAEAKHSRFRVGQAETVGRRPTMEDVTAVLEDHPRPGASTYCVFDGHGGREAAEFASKQLPKAISDRLKTAKTADEAIAGAFKFTQIDMKSWCMYVGCTACIAMVEGRELTVANVGDTRAVLVRGGEALRLTKDHKPDLPEEKEYIEQHGNMVKDGRVGGMLAVSRALGDGFLGDAVNPLPHIVHETLTTDDTILILACDGVWDVMSDQEAADMAAGEIDPLSAAMKIRDEAYDRNSTDNISVVVVFLGEALAQEEKENEKGSDV